MRRALAAVTAGLMALSLVAAADDDRDVTAELAIAYTSTATDQRQALAAEAQQVAADNITCTIGTWTAVNQTAAEVRGVVFVNGRDVGTADGACSNADVLGNPAEFRSFLDITFEFLDPQTRTWVEFSEDDCRASSAYGQAVFTRCTHVHQYLDRSDPIQTYVRRAKFELGVFDGATKEVRSTRYFGPFADRAAFELITISGPQGG
ncbi:MAG: hypothetical protein ACLGIR_13765 [Actinomycetes bacterium]